MPRICHWSRGNCASGDGWAEPKSRSWPWPWPPWPSWPLWPFACTDLPSLPLFTVCPFSHKEHRKNWKKVKLFRWASRNTDCSCDKVEIQSLWSLVLWQWEMSERWEAKDPYVHIMIQTKMLRTSLHWWKSVIFLWTSDFPPSSRSTWCGIGTLKSSAEGVQALYLTEACAVNDSLRFGWPSQLDWLLVLITAFQTHTTRCWNICQRTGSSAPFHLQSWSQFFWKEKAPTKCASRPDCLISPDGFTDISVI